MMKAHICIAKRATSRFCERGMQDGEGERPGGAGGDRHRSRDPGARRSSGTAIAAPSAPAAPARKRPTPRAAGEMDAEGDCRASARDVIEWPRFDAALSWH